MSEAKPIIGENTFSTILRDIAVLSVEKKKEVLNNFKAELNTQVPWYAKFVYYLERLTKIQWFIGILKSQHLRMLRVRDALTPQFLENSRQYNKHSLTFRDIFALILHRCSSKQLSLTGKVQIQDQIVMKMDHMIFSGDQEDIQQPVDDCLKSIEQETAGSTSQNNESDEGNKNDSGSTSEKGEDKKEKDIQQFLDDSSEGVEKKESPEIQDEVESTVPRHNESDKEDKSDPESIPEKGGDKEKIASNGEVPSKKPNPRRSSLTPNFKELSLFQRNVQKDDPLEAQEIRQRRESYVS